jgi:hypothetical protein
MARKVSKRLKSKRLNSKRLKSKRLKSKRLSKRLKSKRLSKRKKMSIQKAGSSDDLPRWWLPGSATTTPSAGLSATAAPVAAQAATLAAPAETELPRWYQPGTRQTTPSGGLSATAAPVAAQAAQARPWWRPSRGPAAPAAPARASQMTARPALRRAVPAGADTIRTHWEGWKDRERPHTATDPEFRVGSEILTLDNLNVGDTYSFGVANYPGGTVIQKPPVTIASIDFSSSNSDTFNAKLNKPLPLDAAQGVLHGAMFLQIIFNKPGTYAVEGMGGSVGWSIDFALNTPTEFKRI